MTGSPRILLLGDYSNCHRTLATGLRQLGCDVTIASDGSKWMMTDRDIDLSRSKGKLGGLGLYLKLRYGSVGRALRGYDIVALSDLNFLSLRPQRIRTTFDRLRRENGKVFLTAMSTDLPFLDMLAAPDSPLRYSEWFVDGKPSRMQQADPMEWQRWHNPALVDSQRHILDNLDGAVSVLYEYQLAMERALGKERTAYGGIPIDTSAFTPVDLPENPEKIRFFLGRDRNRKLVKGSDYLETAAHTVVDRHPDKAELVIVENRPYNEFITLLRDSHIVLDQIYSYTPATTALMAMAYGLNVVSGAEPEYYDFIGETENRPIINAPIDLPALTETLDRLVTAPTLLAPRGRQSRDFVIRHNDLLTVGRRFLTFWTTH